MKTYMDYSNPKTIFESGARAFNLGIARDDCPIERRTHTNGRYYWHDGWDSEAAKTCSGINCKAKRGVDHSEECINTLTPKLMEAEDVRRNRRNRKNESAIRH